MNFKTLMIIVIFLVSVISIPTMVFGQEDKEIDENEGQAGAFKDFRGGFGGVFSENLGYGGEMIARLFEMLLLDGIDFEDDDYGDGIYVLSATDTEIYTGEYDFTKEGDTREIHYLPFADEYNATTMEWKSDGLNDYNISQIEGAAYCEVIKEGGFDYDLTIGAALTLIIWDYDGSFIEAAEKILDWAEKYNEAEDKDELDSELVSEGIEILTWLLVHINEIFTGDELFVFNPIVWQTLDITPWNGTGNDFNITKTWYDTGADMGIDDSDQEIEDIDPAILTDWNDTAKIIKDSYMQWLLNPFSNEEIVETIWTQFSFDVAQLWMKNFYIEIDVGELDNIEDEDDVKEVFEGCNIELYLFTHHLAGVFLYDDVAQPGQNEPDGKLTVNYDYLRNETDGSIIYTNGTAAKIPTTTEVTHQLILGTVGEFIFEEPEVIDDDIVKWGLTLTNVNISAVPVGVDLNSYLKSPQEGLSSIYFGLEFETDLDDPDEQGEIEASGMLKLDTHWAEWNGGKGPNNLDVKKNKLDMAIIYISTVLHFELDVDKDDDPDDPDSDYLQEQDYNGQTNTLKVGDYLDEDLDDKLDFVDIAGPGYTLINSTGNNIIDQATTSIIPVALWEYERVSNNEYAGEETTEDDFSSDYDSVIEAQWNILLYAVCYPGFNGTGKGIWHDPTFSVYMVFTPETTEFWAVILLISGISLVGIATILIKRRKDKRI
ncbi:MAG: hypothetical protein ACFFAH_02230 [Promethearchaeota archaeon]